MNKIFVCQVEELDEGDALKVDCDVGGIAALAVFNFNGEFFAMNDKCSHGNASMSEGYLEDDGTVECPLHSSRFCLKTGVPQCVPATDPIQTFPVVVEDGALFVELSGVA
ncbi:3-phenylpropionate/cinnamic acid dioxygenase ferredoxin subunit [Acinetobacter sp. ANC 4639]